MRHMQRLQTGFALVTVVFCLTSAGQLVHQTHRTQVPVTEESSITAVQSSTPALMPDNRPPRAQQGSTTHHTTVAVFALHGMQTQRLALFQMPDPHVMALSRSIRSATPLSSTLDVRNHRSMPTMTWVNGRGCYRIVFYRADGTVDDTFLVSVGGALYNERTKVLYHAGPVLMALMRPGH